MLYAMSGRSQPASLDNYNITWNSQSKNSAESMPCGGGDIGLNVWVENGDILFMYREPEALTKTILCLKQAG
jgi:hypothetical protein